MRPRRGSAGRLPPRTSPWCAGPLAQADFRLLSAGQLTSTIGDYCYAVALPWLVLATHGGPVLLGTVLACYGVPRAVMIPAGGIMADKLSPRLVMLAADVVRAIVVAGFAALVAHGHNSIAILGPVAALLGAGEGVFLPASAAIMPTMLAPGDLQAGNGLSAAAVQVGSLLGPILGGLLVTAAGVTSAFAIDAATFAVSAVTLALIRAQAQAPAQEPGGAGPVIAGVGLDGGAPVPTAGSQDRDLAVTAHSQPADQSRAWRHLTRARELQVLVLLVGLVSLVIAGSFQVALPTIAHARFGAAGYGSLLACFGAGSLAGTLIAARQGGLRRPTEITALGLLVSAIAVATVPFLGGLPGAAAAVLIFGAGANFGNVTMITVLQRWAPTDMLGRATSLVMLASMGTFPIAVSASGFIVHGIGPAPFFPVAGAVLAVAVTLAVSQRAFREFGVPAR